MNKILASAFTIIVPIIISFITNYAMNKKIRQQTLKSNIIIDDAFTKHLRKLSGHVDSIWDARSIARELSIIKSKYVDPMCLVDEKHNNLRNEITALISELAKDNANDHNKSIVLSKNVKKVIKKIVKL